MQQSSLTTAGLAAVFCCLIAGTQKVRSEEPDHALVVGFERFYQPGVTDEKLADGGLLLLQELNCVACHKVPEGWQERMGKRGVLSLEGVGNRLPVDEMKAFITDPHTHKPGSLMPGMLKAASGDDVDALVAYLHSLKKSVKEYPQGNVEEGKQLYHTIGCVACHAPTSVEKFRPQEAIPGMEVERPKVTSIPLKLGKHYDFHALAAFIQDPLSIRHAGRMPSIEMTDQEAANLAAYLKDEAPLPDPEAVSDEQKPASKEPANALLAKGSELFTSLRCVSCHDTGKAAEPAMALGLDKLSTGKGCLSTQPSPEVPHYVLTGHQIRAIELALKLLQSTPKPPVLAAAAESDAFMVKMNCYACHEWKGHGGMEKARAQYFTVIEASAHSLGEMGMLPPKLDVAGRKLTKGWMERLLWGEKGGVRPYMTARMPRFGKENSESFIAPFAEACKNEHSPTINTSGLEKHHRAEYGRVLLGTGIGGMGCVSCHGLKDRKSLGVPVVNLTHTVERLQPEYFKELLLNPQAVQPGTLMPPLFLGRKKADLEVEEIWTYLKELDQSRLPDGMLLMGEYELKPEKAAKPVVFRTFLEGAGMEAIAVGYPQQVHVAFDAHEVRWALIWKGRFIDAMTTWEERAMTPAKPLGEEVISLPTYMPLAKLSAAGDTWPETYGSHAGYSFSGYRLNKDGIPAFHYEVDGLKVSETLQPDGAGVRRNVEISGNADGWYFKGMADGAVPQPVQSKDGKASFMEVIKL